MTKNASQSKDWPHGALAGEGGKSEIIEIGSKSRTQTWAVSRSDWIERLTTLEGKSRDFTELGQKRPEELDPESWVLLTRMITHDDELQYDRDLKSEPPSANLGDAAVALLSVRG